MRRKGVVLGGVTAALALLAGRAVSALYADWAWYAAHDATAVFRTALLHELVLRVGTASAAFSLAFANLYALRRSIVSLVLPRRLGNIEIGEAVSPRTLLGAVLAASALLAVILSPPVGDWTAFALARIAEPFREMDPYLDRDLSFVVAWLPFEADLHQWMTRAVTVVMLLTVVLYALTPSLRLRRGEFYVSVYCRRHLATLAAIGLLLVAWRNRLDALAISSLGPGAGNVFGPYEHQVGGPLLSWIAAATAVAAFIVFWTAWNGHLRIAGVVTVAAVVGAPLVEVALPRLAARSLTASERRVTERPYAATRLLFTRRAFGVDAIEVPRDRTMLPSNAGATVGRASLWDPAALVRSAVPSPPNRTVALGWHASQSRIVATAIIGPEPPSRAWGRVAFDAAAADERGRALPAVLSDPSDPSGGQWEDLLVFPGAAGAVVLSDTTGNLPAPAFESMLDRVAHAWNARAPRLAIVEPPAIRPRIVARRDVRQRVTALAPFLTMGPSITPVVRGDSLYWVAELFTVARAYPLSEHLVFAGELRPYVHHAATAFVHAGTGRVTLVASQDADAIMRTWMRRFPELFIPAAQLPRAIAERRPPAFDWHSIQATALARAGMGEASEVGRGTVAVDNADADLTAGGPSVFLLPDGRPAWTTALVGAAGEVTGFVVGTGGVAPSALWFAAGQGGRWSDVLDQLQQSADSAGVGRQRRSARRGAVRTVPTVGGEIHLQTQYEWRADGPVVAGVAAVVGGTARAGGTAAEALGLPAVRRGEQGMTFRTSVDALYRRMREALRTGDWPAFGAAFSALGELLRPSGR